MFQASIFWMVEKDHRFGSIRSSFGIEAQIWRSAVMKKGDTTIWTKY